MPADQVKLDELRDATNQVVRAAKRLEEALITENVTLARQWNDILHERMGVLDVKYEGSPLDGTQGNAFTQRGRPAR